MRIKGWALWCMVGFCWPSVAQAQLDDYKRELIQLGYNQPLEGHAPLAAYAFYYLNVPHFVHTNLYLRLALAPVFLDSELGFKGLLGDHTDLGVGIFGGGFADSYFELHEGQFLQSQSFNGNGGGGDASIYHRFNPHQRIPLNGIFRTEVRYSAYNKDSATASDFTLPEDRTTLFFRTGLRWGGREPLMLPEVAMEVSAWHEGQIRLNHGPYGFNGDRSVNLDSHLFWSRALLTYTFPKLRHSFTVNTTLGTSIATDRFSAYRLGGVLPLSSEFPLSLPGYYYQEFSANRFLLLGGTYSVPLGEKKRWAIQSTVATALVDYLHGLQQPGHWLTGVGGGLIYHSPRDSWQVMLNYGYGIDAIRSNGRGAHSVGILVQFDLERANVSLFEPGQNPIRSRGLEQIWNSLRLF